MNIYNIHQGGREKFEEEIQRRIEEIKEYLCKGFADERAYKYKCGEISGLTAALEILKTLNKSG